MTAAVRLHHDAPAAMTIDEAAHYTGQSPLTLRRATKATDPDQFPHPLRVKRAGHSSNARLLFLRADLDDWLDRLPDA